MTAGTTPGEVRRTSLLIKEELAVGILLSVLIFLGAVRVWGEGQRPATDASLRASLPKSGHQLRVAATDQSATEGGIRVQLRALNLVRYPAKASSVTGSSLILALPVAAAACKAWRDRAGHGCDRRTRLHDAGLSLTWNAVQAMHLSLRSVSGLSLRPSDPHAAEGRPTEWSLEPSSGLIRATVTCLRQTDFILITGAGSLRSKCVSGGRLLRLVVTPNRGVNDLSLHGVKEIHLHAEAGTVSSLVGAGTATTDDRELSVEGLGQRIEMTSDSGAVTVGMDDPAAAAASFHAHAAVAKSVKVGRAEVVPTLFERHEAIWWSILIALGVALIAAYWNMYNTDPGGSKS